MEKNSHKEYIANRVLLLLLSMFVWGLLLPHISVKAAQAISVVKIVESAKTPEGYPVYYFTTDVGGVKVNENNPPCWYDPDGHECGYADFKPGLVYTWRIYFDLNSNYYFAKDLKREGCTSPEWLPGADCYYVETKFICPSPIHKIDLYNIEIPVEGGLPNNSYNSVVYSGRDVVYNIKPIGSYGWKVPYSYGLADMRSGETFVGLHEYCYHIQLIAYGSYYFADDIRVTFNGEPIEYEWGGNDSIIIRYDYVCPTSKDVIDRVSLINVTFPAVGQHPSKTHSDCYGVDFKNFYWTESGSDNSLSSSYIYESGKTYTLHIAFEPKDGYILSKEVECTVNGKPAVYSYTNLKRVVFTLDYYLQEEKYTVSFELNGHGKKIDSQTVVKGNKATMPPTPEESGWIFLGWCSDASCKVGFSFNKAINSDTILYAKWEKIEGNSTPTPAPTGTAAPSSTPIPTITSAPTSSLTATPAPTSSLTATPTPASSLTATPTQTLTPTPELSPTLTSMPEPTSTAKPTSASEPAPTDVTAPTATPTPVPTSEPALNLTTTPGAPDGTTSNSGALRYVFIGILAGFLFAAVLVAVFVFVYKKKSNKRND